MPLAIAAQKESVLEYNHDKPKAENLKFDLTKEPGNDECKYRDVRGIVRKAIPKNVQLFVSAKGLTDLDVFSLSDPFCTLKVKSYKSGEYIAYGQTEVIENNLNPKWVKHFNLKFYEDDVQWLCFEVWDDDEEEHELIGKTEL